MTYIIILSNLPISKYFSNTVWRACLLKKQECVICRLSPIDKAQPKKSAKLICKIWDIVIYRAINSISKEACSLTKFIYISGMSDTTLTYPLKHN